ncbi:MAG: lipopolysaccharide biosynthesis protein [Prevotella sp.]|jgi:O-antigen/teichoic acid export membrane protein|nr:lipopolysaccharide biosynthesis protein [Prevotella sp.]
MAKSLKEQTTSALFWSFMDKGGQQFLQLAFMFILSQLIIPDELGLIAVLVIFSAVANIMQESGFSSALIRKQNADEADYASIFYFNIGISVTIYIILFIAAPWIAAFYKQPVLTGLSRFVFLGFVFNALGIIQNVHLIKKMDFKTNARISILASLISGMVAVAMAYFKYGVWSLAVQQVLQAMLRSLFLWMWVKWYPKEGFQLARIKALYNYSSKLLLNSLFNQIAGNITSMIMGKKFLFSDAGNYSNATKFGYVPQSVIASSLSSVTFPLLNNIGDNQERRNRVFRKIVRVISFVCFPLAAFTFVAADPIVLTFLREKWIGAIPMLRILSVGSSVLPLLYLLTSLLQSLGRSGLLLTMEFTRNLLTVLGIFIASYYGISQMLWVVSIMTVITFFSEYYVTGRIIGYKMFHILKDVLPYAFLAVLSFGPLYFLSVYISNNLLLLVLQGVIGASVYLILLKLAGSKVMDDFLSIIKGKKLNV